MLKCVLATVLAIALIATQVCADAFDDVKQRGTLLVGVDAGGIGAILSVDSGGHVVGQDADLNALIAQKLGVKLRMVETAWPGIIPALLAGRFDMILSGMTATKERAKRVNFSTPYGDSSLVAAILASNTAVNKPDDLAGKTVGVLLGTTSVDFAEKFSAKLVDGHKPAMTIRTYDTLISIFVELTNKNVDAVIVPRPVMLGKMVNTGTFKIIDGLGEKSYFCVAVRKEDVRLLLAVNAILMEAKTNGTLATLQKKWLGAPSGKLPDSWDQSQ